ncbi:MAG: DUF953 domain-containing protein [Bacteroidales bacterium]|nr:DUF953 domain-containing protein [Bacteroidales bacterium]
MKNYAGCRFGISFNIICSGIIQPVNSYSQYLLNLSKRVAQITDSWCPYCVVAETHIRKLVTSIKKLSGQCNTILTYFLNGHFRHLWLLSHYNFFTTTCYYKHHTYCKQPHNIKYLFHNYMRLVII